MFDSKIKYLETSFLVSSIGNWLYRLAIPIIILEKSGSASQAATAFGISFIPWIVFSLIGGSLADNFNKRSILILGNIFASFFTLFVIISVILPEINFKMLYIAIFLLASIDPLIHPSFQSIIPELSLSDDFVKINATIQTIDNTLSILGPLIGGSLVVCLGSVNVLWINVFSFLLASLLLLKLSKSDKKENIKIDNLLSKLWKDTKEGATYSFSSRTIFSGSLMFLATNFAINLFDANFIYYMTKMIKLPLIDATIAMSIAGIGALVAGLIGFKFIGFLRAGQILVFSTISAGLTTFLLLFTRNYLLIGLILGLVSFFGTINVITYFSLRQRTVPTEILGRVVAVTRMISYASIPFGSFMGGWLLTHGKSMTLVIFLAGFIRTISGIGAYFSPLGKEK
ncbi:MAG: MFS transporter [Lactobacillaceae bacterium]|jgi:MFS family permease|nr:MFS transporter [Lactobacillaceae bacterium]